MPTKTKLPNKSQAAAIAHFAGRPFPDTRWNETTRDNCRRNGWIEPTDDFPYHRATADGVAALDAYEQANQTATNTTRLMDLVRAYGQTCYLNTPNTAEAHRLLAQIEQAITGKQA